MHSIYTIERKSKISIKDLWDNNETLNIHIFKFSKEENKNGVEKIPEKYGLKLS